MEKKIYIVQSFGGQYEDSWEHIEKAFTSKKNAKNYIAQLKRKQVIDDKKYHEIMDYICEEEGKIWEKYYIETPDGQPVLREGYTEEQYDNEDQEFEDVTKYDLILKKYGFTKEQFDEAVYRFDWDFCGYRIEETILDYDKD